MVPPSQARPTWQQGVLQIHITRACDMACFGCTQGSNLAGKPVMMTPEEFEECCISLMKPKPYFGVIGVFGGNPAMVPWFDEICRVMRKHIPPKQRGLWCNHPRGKGKIMAETFNPNVSNLNVHLCQEAYDEFKRDWPKSKPIGLHEDSRHSPPFVAMKDVILDESERWELIADCDINKNWSAMVCKVPGKGLRAFFCEIAGAMCMLHANDPNWPDVGLPVTKGWWTKPMSDFREQVQTCCHSCGIPLRRYGQLATDGTHEEVSKTHLDIYVPKAKGRKVVEIKADKGKHLATPVTNYIENSEV